MEYIYEIVHIYALFNVHLSIWNVVPVYLFVIVNLCIFCDCVPMYFFVVVNYLILDGFRELQVGTYPDILNSVFYCIWNT